MAAVYVYVCSPHELQPVARKSPSTEKSVVEGSPEYDVIPAFSEAGNPIVMSNVAYGAVQLQQLDSRRGVKLPETIGDNVVADSPHDSGLGPVNPSTHANGTNNEEEPTYDAI